MTIYTIKRTNGDQNFEVSAPDKEWVEAHAKDFAQEFITSKTTSKKASKSRTTSASRAPTTRTSPNEGHVSVVREKLNTEKISELVSYVEARQKAFDKTAPNQAVIIAKFLKDSLKIELINKEDLAYIYKQVGVWELVNHDKQLQNAADRNNYFTRNDGHFKLSYGGEKFALDTAKDSTKE